MANSDKPASLFERVFTEEKGEKKSLLSRIAKGWDNVERAASSDPETRGERPKFLENPLAHITHRAAERMDREKGGSSGSTKSEKPEKGAWSAASLGKAADKKSSARETLQKLRADTKQGSAKRAQQRGSSGDSSPQWGRAGDVVRPLQVGQAKQPFIPPPPTLGRKQGR